MIDLDVMKHYARVGGEVGKDIIELIDRLEQAEHIHEVYERALREIAAGDYEGKLHAVLIAREALEKGAK